MALANRLRHIGSEIKVPVRSIQHQYFVVWSFKLDNVSVSRYRCW